MPESALTRDVILEAAEKVLRRFGPTKANVVDVARMLGVSHGSVYRHFPSKAALVDAVVERWLADVAEPLAAIVAEPATASDRLTRWLDTLVATKQRRARVDPELFATYVALTADARDVVQAHVATLIAQLASIIADGVRAGAFAASDPSTAAQAVFDATARFHNPVNAAAWSRPEINAEYVAVRALVLAGLARGAG